MLPSVSTPITCTLRPRFAAIRPSVAGQRPAGSEGRARGDGDAVDRVDVRSDAAVGRILKHILTLQAEQL